ncbi:hypothetical protein KCF3NO3_24840 [Chryseobacterium sp. KCF3-3]|jgi:hypothetical protein
MKKEETVTVFNAAFSGVFVGSWSAKPATNEPAGIATIPYGLSATNDLVFSLGINSPFVPGFPTEELPPPEQDTDATDADNNKRNILFMLIFIIKP